MSPLEHVLERTVLIRARRETVFRYFTDSARFATWWGEGSSVDPRPGGALRIRYPNGVVASGEVVEIVPLERVLFTFGYEGADKPIPPGGSRVIVLLEEAPHGTLVHLRHELPTAEARDAHVPGWRYQLALFANVAAREQHAEAGSHADRLFAAWAEPDAEKRRASLVEIATPDVSFRDAFACTEGLDELVEHISASQVHMPGVRPERRGEPRQCQGTALVDWLVRAGDGRELGSGTNVLELAPDGRIARVTGIWS
jgi:uncharacterized protein YndB with AHSA1/START domain